MNSSSQSKLLSISGFWGDCDLGIYERGGFFSLDACGGSSIWTIGLMPDPNTKGLLWSVPYRDHAFIYVYDAYDHASTTTPFVELLTTILHPAAGGAHVDVIPSDTDRFEFSNVIVHTNTKLPGWDEDADGLPYPGLWSGRDGDDLEGTVSLIDVSESCTVFEW